jgi:CheY-like chemotaxis protein
MTPEAMAHIFEPFFTTKELGKGTGLGLATVDRIVAQSDGFIDVESEPGRGTTFHVFLPRAHEAPPSPGSDPGPSGRRAGRETVLVVEDEEQVRGLASRALETVGYTVLEARDGEQALEVSARHPGPIHLLLTDVVMPGMNGQELAGRLLALRPGVKVLYVTGYVDDSVRFHAELKPGMATMPKPFTASSLARKVREILDSI